MRFCLLDRILELEPGVRVTAVKRLRPDEDYLKDHFHREPGEVVFQIILVRAQPLDRGHPNSGLQLQNSVQQTKPHARLRPAASSSGFVATRQIAGSKLAPGDPRNGTELGAPGPGLVPANSGKSSRPPSTILLAGQSTPIYREALNRTTATKG